MKVFIFWSYIPEWWSKAIVWITGKQLPDESDAFSHMGIGFEYGDGKREYFEAIIDEGFSGPKPYEKLFNKTKSGQLVLEWLQFSPEDAEKLWIECQAWVGKKSYSARQLIQMYFFERLGIPVPRSPGRVVCSEAVTRLIGEQIARRLKLSRFYDLRDEKRKTYDEVNPNSAYRKRVADGSMFERIHSCQKKS